MTLHYNESYINVLLLMKTKHVFLNALNYNFFVVVLVFIKQRVSRLVIDPLVK